ncbi:MAG: carboxymuconolactone decarboxylase family protein [Mariniphaga sp.]
MTKFQVPTREQVTPENQAIFDKLNSQMGFVPNIYATYAFSKDALGRYMNFAGGKTSLTAKEKEVINLIVSQVNGCTYCLAAHTAVGKMTGFTDEQILELRKGSASFDTKLDALVKLAKSITENRGNVDDATLDAFLNAGYDKGNLVDLILAVGEKSITNFLHKVTDIPIDFPEAPTLS